MSEKKDYKSFSEALHADEEFRKKFDETCNRIVVDNNPKSEAEVLVEAAKELGYEVSLEEFERSIAELENDDDLEKVSGGKVYECDKLYYCYLLVSHDNDRRKDVACWSDFICRCIYHSEYEEIYTKK